MAAEESHEPLLNLGDEAPITPSTSNRRFGGWITFPFIAACQGGQMVATFGICSNITVYLIKQFNVKNIDATQISNIISGCTCLAPVAGAIIADSYFGCFAVVAVSCFISFMGMVILTLTATTKSLRPPPCTSMVPCQAPSLAQYVVLYFSIALIGISMGGTRYTIIVMGADQFNNPSDRDTFFNWYFLIIYVMSILGSTVMVYIEDNVSWALGFGLCTIFSAASFVVLVLGARYYHNPKLEGSPFTGLARVVVAAIRKRKMGVSPETLEYYHECGEGKPNPQAPTKSFRFLNNAAVKAEGDTNTDGTIARPWRLCTVEQVQDLKTIVKILPLWIISIPVMISVSIQGSLTVLQALTVNRHLGPHFSVPVGSLIVSMLGTVAIMLPILDRVIYPAWRKLTGRTPTFLQRIGVGYAVNIVGMVASALVERRRLGIIQEYDMADRASSVVPMSVMWLVLTLAVVGVGEALHFPTSMALFYQEFPKSLKSLGTGGMVSLLQAVGYYLGAAVIDLVRGTTDWLPDNINTGQLDKVYWMLAMVSALDLVFFMVCTKLYRYQGLSEEAGDKDQTTDY